MASESDADEARLGNLQNRLHHVADEEYGKIEEEKKDCVIDNSVVSSRPSAPSSAMRATGKARDGVLIITLQAVQRLKPLQGRCRAQVVRRFGCV